MNKQTLAQNERQSIHLKDYELPNFLIEQINLEFDLQEEYTIVKSLLDVRYNSEALSTKRNKNLLLDGEELQLLSIKINNQTLNPAEYELNDQYLIIYNAPDQFQLEMINKIFPQNNTALSGLYRSQNKYCTQCEAEGFRHVTYFMDRPDILSRYTVKIIADRHLYPFLLSNGNLIASGQLSEGRHWAKWQDPFKKPCYLFALVAGDFDVIEDNFITQSKQKVTLRIYVEKGYSNQAHHAMYSLKEAMRWDEATYGCEYDLNIYMIVAINDFNMGAMENKGLNIFNTKYILAKPETATDDDYINIFSVIGHEYFHNWSGNRVTCRDWFQLSLKEGLTIFRDQTFSEDLLSSAVMRIRDISDLREVQFPEDAGPLAHPVCPDSYIEINNFYTSTIYNKGAEVLRMLRTILGLPLFRKGMDLYFKKFDGKAATIEDYIEVMEEVSGKDLTQFRLWYKQIGTPLITVEDDYNAHQQLYTLTISQSYPPHLKQTDKLPLYIPIKMGLLDQQGEEIPLVLDNEPVTLEKVLVLTTTIRSFQFKKVLSQPLPSLFRNFSAPVKLNYAYSDDDLLFLFKHDKDSFNRWEAAQKYFLNILLQLLRTDKQNTPLSLPSGIIEIFNHTLTSIEDQFFAAELLSLPSEKYIGEQMEIVDVDGIHIVREFVLTEIAQQLKKQWLTCYQQHHQHLAHDHFKIEEIGKRQFKNCCLSYLMRLSDYLPMGMQQFKTSLTSNMTDTQAALIALANTDSALRSAALQQFYSTWKHDPLVMDKWLAIQATSKLTITLQEVKQLTRHEIFDIKNPNKVYALLGSFSHRNLVNFHAQSGEGYAFLGEMVQQLDQLNPQIAARMIKPLTTWQRYDKNRQKLMREQLELLLKNKKISSDLYEIASKSL